MEFAEKNVAFGSQITQNAQIKYDWDYFFSKKRKIRRKNYAALGSQITQNAQIKYDWDYFFLAENGEFAEKIMLHLAHR